MWARSARVCGLLARSFFWVVSAFCCYATLAVSAQNPTQQPPIATRNARSGPTFTSAPIAAQQKDDDRNPGMLWVDQGREIFSRDCVACHTEAKGLATKLPKLADDGSVVTL